jgi:hypothetical protein
VNTPHESLADCEKALHVEMRAILQEVKLALKRVRDIAAKRIEIHEKRVGDLQRIFSTLEPRS